MDFPITDLGKLPVILTMAEMSGLYRISKRTIQRQLQTDEFQPLPYAKYPYRWRKEDVIRDLQTRRVQQKMRRHGFATTKAR